MEKKEWISKTEHEWVLVDLDEARKYTENKGWLYDHNNTTRTAIPPEYTKKDGKLRRLVAQEARRPIRPR